MAGGNVPVAPVRPHEPWFYEQSLDSWNQHARSPVEIPESRIRHINIKLSCTMLVSSTDTGEMLIV